MGVTEKTVFAGTVFRMLQKPDLVSCDVAVDFACGLCFGHDLLSWMDDVLFRAWAARSPKVQP